MTPTNAFLLSVALLLASSAAAATECHTLQVPLGRVVTIETAINHATRIQLPEPVIRDMPGNPELWQVQTGPAEHYWIKPTDLETEDGASTSLTLITARRAWDFVVRRVASPEAPCYVLDEPLVLGSGSAIAYSAPRSITAAAPTPSADSLHTRYRWKTSAVEAIYDDGRYTYVRLAPRPSGLELPVIHGGTPKAPELLDASYDATDRVFRIPGIHSGFVIREGKKVDRVERAS